MVPPCVRIRIFGKKFLASEFRPRKGKVAKVKFASDQEGTYYPITHG